MDNCATCIQLYPSVYALDASSDGTSRINTGYRAYDAERTQWDCPYCRSVVASGLKCQTCGAPRQAEDE